MKRNPAEHAAEELVVEELAELVAEIPLSIGKLAFCDRKGSLKISSQRISKHSPYAPAVFSTISEKNRRIASLSAYGLAKWN